MLLLTLFHVTTNSFFQAVPMAQKLGPGLPSSVGPPCTNQVRLNINQLESIAKELCKTASLPTLANLQIC